MAHTVQTSAPRWGQAVAASKAEAACSEAIHVYERVGVKRQQLTVSLEVGFLPLAVASLEHFSSLLHYAYN